MATPRKHWFNVTEALCRAGLDNDELACAIRLMGEMNAQRARDELDPEAACRIRLRPGTLADVSGKRQPHAARALVARAAHALRTLAEYDVSADLTRPEFVSIEWLNLAELQDWHTRTPGERRPEVARQSPTPTPDLSPDHSEEESPLERGSPAKAELLGRGRKTPEPPAEAVQFAADFFDGLQAVHEGFRAPTPQAYRGWQNDARLLLGERELAQAQEVARWLFEDPGRDATFWRPNVMSVKTFRKQYQRLLALSRSTLNGHQDEGPLARAARNIQRDIEAARR